MMLVGSVRGERRGKSGRKIHVRYLWFASLWSMSLTVSGVSCSPLFASYVGQILPTTWSANIIHITHAVMPSFGPSDTRSAA